MFCKKCGQEIPDLSMYCPECGAPQIGSEPDPIELKLEDPRKAKVVIQSVDNMTNAIAAVRDISGLDFVGARKALSELPAVLFTNLSTAAAEDYVQQLSAAGITAAVEGGVKTEKPVTAEGEIDPAFDKELDQFEKDQELIMPKPQEEPEAKEEPKPTFEEEMEAFLNAQEDRREPEVQLELPDEAPAKTDEEFEKEMAAFLADK